MTHQNPGRQVGAQNKDFDAVLYTDLDRSLVLSAVQPS